jgi:hypothetical protein
MPSKAAKTEAMRIGGPVLRNEPNLLTEIGVPLRSMRRRSALRGSVRKLLVPVELAF